MGNNKNFKLNFEIKIKIALNRAFFLTLIKINK